MLPEIVAVAGIVSLTFRFSAPGDAIYHTQPPVSLRASGQSPSAINWYVIRNGLDFTESAVEHLRGGTERDLRYAALHLNAGIETLLKARLAREHWTLVVDRVDSLERSDYERGDFRSVTIKQAVGRLTKVVGPSVVTDRERKRFEAVESLRNRVAHFALLDDKRQRTVATVACGLDALLHFIDREFIRTADSDEAHLAGSSLKRLREVIGEIESLARERMKRLRPELAKAHLIVECGSCRQPALCLRDGADADCLYCLDAPLGRGSAHSYMRTVLGKQWAEGTEGTAAWPAHDCPQCGRDAFVDGVVPLGLSGRPVGASVWACFACGYSCADQDVDYCPGCRALVHEGMDGQMVCDRCHSAGRAD